MSNTENLLEVKHLKEYFNINTGMLSARFVNQSGIPPSINKPVTLFITIANPVNPPVTNPIGS